MSLQPYCDGPPRFDVGLKPIDLATWLLPDDQSHWIGPKNKLIDTRRDDVFVEQPSSRPAQNEAAALIGLECGHALRADCAPLLAASRLVSDDLVIMQHVDGNWTNTACCLCSPTFFSAAFATGKSLHALHEPIPDGDFGLASRIDRVFTNLSDTVILERHNWTVQWSDARFTPDATAMREDASRADLEDSANNLFLRVERQTIRRLPLTGAILFTIRIRLSPLRALLKDAQHRIAFLAAWRATPQHVRSYKHWAVLERHVNYLLEA
jgi:dimethylamine monooxygenase subunit A